MNAVSTRSGENTASAMPLRRVLIVVEAGGAEREVEIGDHGIQREIARDRPGHVVRDGGRADAALGADDGDDAADGLGFRRRKQPADRAHHVEGVDRRNARSR